MKVGEKPECAGCPMLKVQLEYEKQGKKILHIQAEQNFVPPKWGSGLRLRFGEAPGEAENIQMEPMVGPAGQFQAVLDRKAGIVRDELTILNVIQCRPPNNIHPMDPGSRKYISSADAEAAIRHCYRAHVRPILLARPWNRIDILGAKALQLLTGLSNLLAQRGSPLTVDTDEVDKRMGIK